MKLEVPLLGLLAARRMSGYDIKKWTEIEGKFVGLDRHSSQIYRELNRMQVEGYITFEVHPRDGVPDAKVYRLTEAGMDRLWRWVNSQYVPPRMFQDPEFKFRLQFSAMLDEGRARALVAQEIEARRRQVHDNRLRPQMDDPVDPREEVSAEALRFVMGEIRTNGEREIDSWIDWLEQLLQRFDERDAAQERSLESIL